MKYKVLVTFGHWWNYDAQNIHFHFGPCTEEEGKVFCVALEQQFQGLTPAKNTGFNNPSGEYERMVQKILKKFNRNHPTRLQFIRIESVWTIECEVIPLCDGNLTEATALLKDDE